MSQGERIRFTTYDKHLGVRSGDLGTVLHIGRGNSIRAQDKNTARIGQ